jgi:hypothetical protein
MVSDAFATVLAARRADYNAQFSAARRSSAELDEESFKLFLERSVDPLVSAVASVDPAALFSVVDVAYGVGLELVSQRLVGPRALTSALNAGFEELFPALGRLIAASPERILPALCNALHQLATTPGGRPQQFSDALRAVVPSLTDAETLLAAGQVAAWLSGLAHYRVGALAVAERLPPDLARALLGTQEAELGGVFARLRRDPWFLPNEPRLGFRIVGTVGAFRGFGGAFLEAPRVLRVGEELVVQSGEEAWLLKLDAFGCTFHRVRSEELGDARPQVETPGVVVEQTRVSVRGMSLSFGDSGLVTSAACNSSTVLITTAHSYGVIVVALPPP